MKLITATILIAAMIAGCANGFDKFYQPNQAFEQTRATAVFIPPPATLKIYTHSYHTNADAKQLYQDGYMLIGFSFFTGVANRVSSSQAVAVGKKVGALIVMIKSEYSNTVSGVMPYTTVNPSQTATVSTTGTVSGYGSGGYASGNYTADSTVTVPGGTATNFIPYSVVRNAYFASYWIQRDVSKIRFGANYGPLSDELRHKLERNAGVVINMVVRATPAFVANILEGDIVTKINDEDVIDAGGLNAQVLAHGGQTVQFTILRDTRSLIIPIALGTGA